MVMGSTLECLSHVGGGVYMSHTTGPHSYSKLGIKFPKCPTNAGNSQFAQIPGGNTLEFNFSLLMEQEEYNTVHIRTLTLFSMNSLLNCTYRFLFFLILAFSTVSTHRAVDPDPHRSSREKWKNNRKNVWKKTW